MASVDNHSFAWLAVVYCCGYPGGSVDINEVAEEAAKRELLEETGIVDNSLELFGVFSGEELYYVYPHGDELSRKQRLNYGKL